MTVAVVEPKQTHPKHPDSDIWYEVDWTNHLAEKGSGITVTNADWTIPADLTNEMELISANTKTQVRVSGGLPGFYYELEVEATLSNGETEVAIFTIYCSDDANPV